MYDPVRWMMLLTAGLFSIGAVLMWAGSRHVTAAIRRLRWIKFGTYAVIVWTILGLAALESRWPLILLMVAIAVLGGGELSMALGRIRFPRLRWVWMVYAFSAAGLIRVAVGWYPGPHADFMWLFIVTAVFDSFSQLAGQWWGRTRILPEVSPGKTVAGLVGGSAMVIAVNLLMGVCSPTPHDEPGTSIHWSSALPMLPWVLAYSMPVCLPALAGDLGASWVKRRCGIKDFGNLLPGHGGVLDRFDSLLGTALCFALYTTVRLGR